MSRITLDAFLERRYRAALEVFDDRALGKLARILAKVKTERYVARVAERRRQGEGYRGLANFMAGVTWALACRATLRYSKDHPGYGKRPASGEMWLPRELLTAVRSQVKAAGWHPITAESAQVVLHNLANRNNRELGIDSALPVTRTSIDTPFGEPFEVVKFRVRMVQGNVMSRSRVSDLFDYGGES